MQTVNNVHSLVLFTLRHQIVNDISFEIGYVNFLVKRLLEHFLILLHLFFDFLDHNIFYFLFLFGVEWFDVVFNKIDLLLPVLVTLFGFLPVAFKRINSQVSFLETMRYL